MQTEKEKGENKGKILERDHTYPFTVTKECSRSGVAKHATIKRCTDSVDSFSLRCKCSRK
jgi:hypothetical protein